MSTSLLAEIKTFLAETEMGPSYFGKLAAGNTELVRRLENGQTITLVTAERVRHFMELRRKAARAADVQPPEARP